VQAFKYSAPCSLSSVEASLLIFHLFDADPRHNFTPCLLYGPKWDF